MFCIVCLRIAGLLCVMMARAYGAKQVITTEISPFRKKTALDLGADAVIDPLHEDLGARVEELGGRVDASIECGGIPETFAQCERLTRPAGAIAVFGTHLKPITLDMVFWETNSLSLVLAREQPDETPRLMARTAELMTDPRVQLKPLVTHSFPLDQIGTVFDLLDQRAEGVLKIVVTPE